MIMPWACGDHHHESERVITTRSLSCDQLTLSA